jgi:hypothetical protein
MSTLINTALSPAEVASSSYVGYKILHGPHVELVKKITAHESLADERILCNSERALIF